MGQTLLMGAVAYDPKVVTIWEGFRAWLRWQDFDLDFVLYSNYERQVTDLVAGRLDAAWNSPLAWIRSQRLAATTGVSVSPLMMRDTDRDLRSLVIVRQGSDIESLDGLRGRTVAVGALDSPQATLLPLSLLRSGGIDPGAEVTIRRFDVGVGLHGDHIGGERDAARALANGEVDAACMVDANHLRFVREGTLRNGETRIVAATDPYDHCNMTVRTDAESVGRFSELLEGMSFEDPDVRPLLELEGLRSWEEGRTSGYAALDRAVDEAGFYDRRGAVTALGYRP